MGLRNVRSTLGWKGEGDGEEKASAWGRSEFFVAVFLLAHACIEFDLQFSALAFLLAFLLSNVGPTRVSTAGSTSAGYPSAGIPGIAAAIVCVVALLPACVVGFLCSSTSMAITAASAAGDYAMCASLFEKNPLAMRDVNAQQEYAQVLYAQKSYQKVIDMYSQLPAPSDRTVYYATLAYYALNQQAEATTALIDRLESQPFNTDFYASAQQLATVYGTDSELTARFNAAMDVVARNAGQFQTAY
jgi:tetratricopeptide (TPR) repeat protein